MNTHEFINVTLDNIEDEHLCCIIRSKKKHPGVEAKRAWLKERIKEGHVFRKLNAKATVFIEYAPLENAWVPIVGENYYYIYCLWVLAPETGKGYGKALLEYCIQDAIEHGMSGICMLGSKKQKHWLSDQTFAKKHGFEVVDTTNNGYELLALSFDGTKPSFTSTAKAEVIDNQHLTIYYSSQCSYVSQSIAFIKTYCDDHQIPVVLNHVDTLAKAKALPCVFNNYGIFYKGKFKTVNILLDSTTISRILKI